MKKYSFALIFALLNIVVSAQNVSIPDPNFKSVLVSNLSINTNGDTSISIAEASAFAGSLYVFSSNISDLTGIEAFTNITSLNCSNNDILELDLSNNKNLVSIYCDGNNIDTLILDSLSNLQYLDAASNQLEEIDISNNSNLYYLKLDYNFLDSIDLSNNTKLSNVYLYGNNLDSLEVWMLPQLKILNCGKNNLTYLDVTQNPLLKDLNVSRNLFSNPIDLTLNPLLYDFDCSWNSLATQDVSTNSELLFFNCSHNNFPSVDVSQNLKLSYFDCSYNNITSVDVSVNLALVSFDCEYNSLTTVDVTNNSDLATFYCSGNNLGGVDVSSNPQLQTFYCGSINTTTLDVTNNPLLANFSFYSNQLTTIDLSQNPLLSYLNCNSNPLTSLDLSNAPQLSTFYCTNTTLTQLDVTHNPVLRTVYLDNTKLDSVDFSQNSELFYLRCSGSDMLKLDLTQSPKLVYLICNNNQLTKLNLTQNVALYYVDCSFNSIEKLDLSNAPNLRDLDARNNNLSQLSVLNGNTSNMTTNDFYASNNPMLECIEISDPLYATQNFLFIDPQSFFTTDCFYDEPSNSVLGKMVGDTNCTIDGNEVPLYRRFLQASPNGYFSVTDSLGDYMMKTDSGEYDIIPIMSARDEFLLIPICPVPNFHTVTFDTLNEDTTGIDYHYEIKKCPYLRVEVSSNRRRRCFMNSTKVWYGNEGYADTNNVEVRVDFPEFVHFVSADRPYTIDSNGVYVFDIGFLAAGQSGTINIIDSVACVNEALDMIQCTRAWITPFNQCLDNLDSTTGPAAGWDKSSVMVEGYCVRDSVVEFLIINTGDPGTGDMANVSQYRIYFNNVLHNTGTFQLAGGDTLRIQIPNDGSTVRLEADQRPGHPGNSHPRATVEACGTSANGTFATGYADDAMSDNQDIQVAEECLPVIDSYDPNDKNVLPAGVYAQKYVKPGVRLQYKIRFQNTGTDTAYKVVVVDSLPEELDVSTIEFGVSSHPYALEVSGAGSPVMTFTFNNINLPDSTTNELGSQGFFTFSAIPKSGITPKTKIENFTDIYFDYNDPIRTNTAWVTIFDSVLTASEKHINLCDTTSPPVISMIPKDTLVCKETLVQLKVAGGTGYSWDTVGAITGVTTATPTVTAMAEQHFIVEVSSMYSCYTTVDSVRVGVEAQPVLSISSSDSVICAGDTAQLQVAGASSYVWTPSVSGQGMVNPQTTTTYFVEGTDTNGCVGDTSLEIIVNPLPNVEVDVTDQHICLGEYVIFSVTGANDYTWDKAGVEENVPYYPTVSSFYTATGMDGNACESSDMIRVEVDTLDAYVDFGFDVSGYDLNLHKTASNVLSHYWVIDGVPMYDDEDNPVHALTSNGTYEVCLYGYSHCDSGVYCQTITVNNLGVEEDLADQIRIYPNPSQGNLTLELGNTKGFKTGHFILFDAIGKEVQSVEIVNDKVETNISGLPGGFYIYRVELDGKTVKTGKLRRE